MRIQAIPAAILLVLATAGSTVWADPIIHESFSGYPDNALISDSPAGPAIGLTGDWFLDPDNFFFVNMTEADFEDGTDRAVYDMPVDYNGQRTAQRAASPEHLLFERDGDLFYASFRIQPPRADGVMLFGLALAQADGGGQPTLSFGINEGHFVVGNGGVNTDLSGGAPEAAEMRVVLRFEYGEAVSGPDDDELVTLWVNPESESSAPVLDRVAADLLNHGGGRITGVSMRGDHMAGQPAFFDDLLVGYTFADVVEALPPDALTNHAGMNGLFFDPDNPGHGFSFAVHRLGLTVHYYGHTASGERLWLISENHGGDLEFSSPITLEMFEITSGTFGQPVLPATTWGLLTLELDDCDSGHASLDGLDGDLEMDLVRLSTVPGINCQ